MKNKDLFFVPFPIVRSVPSSVVRRPSSVVGIPVHRSSGVRSTSVGCFAPTHPWGNNIFLLYRVTIWLLYCHSYPFVFYNACFFSFSGVDRLIRRG